MSGVPVNPVRNWQTSSDEEVESARVWQLQLRFFSPTPHEVRDRMGLNWIAACQLHQDGWLSFDPRDLETLNEAQEAELSFLGAFIAAGCDSELLGRLLHGLRRPYQYKAGAIYLDWAAARWRLVPVEEQPYPPEVFTNWLEELKQQGDVETLKELARDVAEAIACASPESGKF